MTEVSLTPLPPQTNYTRALPRGHPLSDHGEIIEGVVSRESQRRGVADTHTESKFSFTKNTRPGSK